LAVAFLACSSHTSEPKKPNGSATPVFDAAVATPGPGEQDCADLFAHAIELTVAEVKKTTPAQAPTADDVAKLSIEVRDQYLSSCRAGTVDGHRCAMASTTLGDLSACQATPSSSTSNSSVAPPGIAPGAPRSP